MGGWVLQELGGAAEDPDKVGEEPGGDAGGDDDTGVQPNGGEGSKPRLFKGVEMAQDVAASNALAGLSF